MKIEIERRACIAGLLMTAVASQTVGAAPAAMAVDTYSLDELNPFLPAIPERIIPIHRAVMQPGAPGRVTSRFARAYKQTGEYHYLEYALMYGFIHWRQLPRSANRIHISKQYQKVALLTRKQFPDQPAGWVWGAMFTGLEMLTRGVMHSLNLLPAYEEQLQVAEKHHSSYYHGMANLLRGKVLMKAPPFPVSIGNFDKGLAYLRRAGETMSDTFAAWHVIMAEALHLTGGKEAAFDILDQIKDVQAPDYGTDFLYYMSLSDAAKLRTAMEKGKYDRYLYDPLLEPMDDYFVYLEQSAAEKGL